jgi:hypothetical protein
VTRLKWKLISIRLEIVLVSVQGRCTVCVKCTIVSKILLDALDGLLGHEAQMEARFGSFGDSVTFSAR